MKKIGIDRRSIKSRVRQSTLFVLLVQVILFGAIIVWGGTLDRLSQEYFKVFQGKIISRARYLEDHMLNQWSDLAEFEGGIQKELDRFGVVGSEQASDYFWKQSIIRIIQVLRKNSVTGAFVILDEEGSHPGIYIRDRDPLVNPKDNSDLLLFRGSAEIQKIISGSLDPEWAEQFNFQKKDRDTDFFYKPFEAAYKYPDLKDEHLGYWSKAVKFSENDIELITYSMPLRNKEGEPYGVIGIELSLDYIASNLYYDELAGDKQGGYLLGVEKKSPGVFNNLVFNNIVTSGPILEKYIGQNTKTVFKDKVEAHEIYLMESSEKLEDTIYGAVQYLNLYHERGPFIDDKWAIVGVIGEEILFSPIKQLWQSITMALLFSLGVGMVVAYITGAWFVRPITKLVKRVLESDPSNPVILSKTKISEIDELATAIESLSDEVAGSSSKLSQIISMVNMPIGAFEYDLRERDVFCTESMFDILGIKKDSPGMKRITSSRLKEIIKDIMKTPEPGSHNVYAYQIEGEPKRWIRMKTQQNNGKLLGVIEDVTKDIMTKHKIEYERDHDVLTQLLNRRAFNVAVKVKLKQEDTYNGAFIMWDLDNLKYINDTYGHDCGDEYIKVAASVLREFEGDRVIVARMSGDEFYTFIYGYKDKQAIRHKVKQIRQKLHTTLLTMSDGTIFRIRASGGVAWYPDDSRDYDELIKYSDFAMYEVKHSDKGNVGEFDRETYDKDSILLYGKEELNQFIEKELVIYNFQPIVDASSGEVFAYEALMRPQLANLKSPMDVIRLAQSQSKLYDIERITLFKSMEAFDDYQEVFGDAKIFINSIPNFVLSEKDLRIFEEKYQDHLDRIVIEIIENEQSEETSTKIKQDIVARWGSSLALDDFGAGYNNETVLLTISPKYIKMDRGIISGIDKDPDRQKILENILSYAHDRDMKVIAEGVETKAEMQKVIKLGVDYLQGYYLGRPQISPQPIAKKIIQEILI